MSLFAKRQSTQWTVALVLTLVGGFVFLHHYVGVIALALLMAYVFYPLFSRIHARLGKQFLSAIASLIVLLLIVIVPIVTVISLTAVQVGGLVTELGRSDIMQDPSLLRESVSGTVDAINGFVAPLNSGESVLSSERVSEFLRTTLPNIITGVMAVLINVTTSVPGMAIAFIIFVVLFVEFLVYGPRLKQLAIQISPFDEAVTRTYLYKIGRMAKAMVNGQLFIAFVIALLTSILFIFLGFGEYFFIMLTVFTILNLIPLGSGILVIPLLLILMLTGSFWPALVALGFYAIISNLDSYIRPRVIPKEVTLSIGLTMLATFAGIFYFGLLGVVYGPIIMIIIVTTVTMYAAHRNGTLGQLAKTYGGR